MKRLNKTKSTIFVSLMSSLLPRIFSQNLFCQTFDLKGVRIFIKNLCIEDYSVLVKLMSPFVS